jgi:tetratricopeptide (TPR) repeat protein
MKILTFIIFLLFNSSCFAIENTNLTKGKKFYQEGKYNESKFELEKSIVFDPKNLESYFYLSKVFDKLKNINEQEKNLKTVLVLDPKNEEALILIISLYIKKGDFEEAKQKYDFLRKACIKCDKLKEIKKSIQKFKS